MILNNGENARIQRNQLRFSETVLEEFLFLREMGFNVVETQPTIVVFKRSAIQVNIYHGRLSYEINLEIVRQGNEYALHSFVAAADSDAEKKYRPFQTSTPEGVVQGVKQLANLAKDYCMQAFNGDPEPFNKAERARSIYMDKYWKEMHADQVRPKAEEAFRHADYGEAARLYADFESELTLVELKKLAFAKERSKHS